MSDAYTQRKARDRRAATPEAAACRAIADRLRYLRGDMPNSTGIPWTVAQAVAMLDLIGSGHTLQETADRLQGIRHGIGKAGVRKMIVRTIASYTPASRTSPNSGTAP